MLSGVAWVVRKAASLGYSAARSIAVTSGTLAFNTGSYVLQEMGVMLEAMRAMYTHPPSRVVAEGVLLSLGLDTRALGKMLQEGPSKKTSISLLYTASTGFSGVVAVLSVNHYIQAYLKSLGVDSSENTSETVSYNLLLTISSTFLNTLANTYALRQGSQMVTRALVSRQAAVRALNQNKEAPQPGSAGVEGLLAQARNLGTDTYVSLSNQLAVYLLAKVPFMELFTHYLLSPAVQGREILRVLTPERPTLDKGIPLENSLATGLSYQFSQWLLRYGFEATVGLPPALILMTLDQMLMIANMAMAARTKIPYQPRDKATVMDPIALWEYVSMKELEIQLKGHMKWAAADLPPLIKELMSGPESDIDWQAIGNQLCLVVNHPATRAMQRILLPKMFHSFKDFLNDPVVKPHQDQIRNYLDSLIVFLIEKMNHPAVKIAKRGKHVIASVGSVKRVLGIPKSVTLMILREFGSDHLVNFLRSLQAKMIEYGLGQIELEQIGSIEPAAQVSDPLLGSQAPQPPRPLRPEEARFDNESRESSSASHRFDEPQQPAAAPAAADASSVSSTTPGMSLNPNLFDND